ncbi:AEC family transporter [Sulfurospirillum arcachonense]|uniref:AEC family transporter n=1 Tax=Sulfurospirillum arcachonense TaxID=57666 RepID=UPI00046AD4AC|nr:AEC family transporter [Sulfurospirillum arcachonense]
MDIVLSVICVYIFILLGYIAKLKLKDELQEKSLVILSIYFLQPMLALWGLSTKPINITLMQAPLIYAAISLLGIIVSFSLAKIFFTDAKERSIATISSVIGNTGNIGIPLGIALFGEDSIIYTSLINVANVFIVYTIGVYFYSRGTFSIKDSLLNILRLPLIWFAILALLLNFFQVEIHPTLFHSLKMGAYAAMVIQLMIFGMYLYSIKLKTINIKLLLHVSTVKFILIPIIALIVLTNLGLDKYIIGIVLLELLVPLAVNNVNLSSIYNCKPVDVTALVFFTSLLFIPYIMFVMKLFDKL